MSYGITLVYIVGCLYLLDYNFLFINMRLKENIEKTENMD